MSEKKPSLVLPADRKIVGINNRPIENVDVEAEKQHEETKRVTVGALREMAEKIEDGTLPCPNSLIVIPITTGEVQMLNFGQQMPEPVLHSLMAKIATRMALQ